MQNLTITFILIAKKYIYIYNHQNMPENQLINLINITCKPKQYISLWKMEENTTEDNTIKEIGTLFESKKKKKSISNY